MSKRMHIFLFFSFLFFFFFFYEKKKDAYHSRKLSRIYLSLVYYRSLHRPYTLICMLGFVTYLQTTIRGFLELKDIGQWPFGISILVVGYTRMSLLAIFA
jgi:hypothetical protein